MRHIILWSLLVGYAAACCAAAHNQYDAVLTQTTGSVKLRFPGQSAAIPSRESEVLPPGTEIRTGSDGAAEIVLAGEGIFVLGSDSLVQITAAEKGYFFLSEGSLLIKVADLLAPGEELRIQSPSMVAAIRGTEAAIDVDRTGETAVGLFEGAMAVSQSDLPAAEILVTEGFQTTVKPGHRPHRPVKLTARMQRHKKKMASIRKRLKAVRTKTKKSIRGKRQKLRRIRKRRKSR